MHDWPRAVASGCGHHLGNAEASHSAVTEVEHLEISTRATSFRERIAERHPHLPVALWASDLQFSLILETSGYTRDKCAARTPCGAGPQRHSITGCTARLLPPTTA